MIRSHGVTLRLHQASLGVVPTTPWNTERECSEDELGKQISEMLEQVPSGQPCILNLHCPPYVNVKGLVAGRSLLYPGHGDVAAAVDTAVSLLALLASRP